MFIKRYSIKSLGLAAILSLIPFKLVNAVTLNLVGSAGVTPANGTIFETLPDTLVPVTGSYGASVRAFFTWEPSDLNGGYYARIIFSFNHGGISIGPELREDIIAIKNPGDTTSTVFEIGGSDWETFEFPEGDYISRWSAFAPIRFDPNGNFNTIPSNNLSVSNSWKVVTIPEPITILGSFTALAFGAMFKCKNTFNKEAK